MSFFTFALNSKGNSVDAITIVSFGPIMARWSMSCPFYRNKKEIKRQIDQGETLGISRDYKHVGHPPVEQTRWCSWTEGTQLRERWIIPHGRGSIPVGQRSLLVTRTYSSTIWPGPTVLLGEKLPPTTFLTDKLRSRVMFSWFCATDVHKSQSIKQRGGWRNSSRPELGEEYSMLFV